MVCREIGVLEGSEGGDVPCAFCTHATIAASSLIAAIAISDDIPVVTDLFIL